MKLIVINTHDGNALEQAMSLDSSVLLMQDAVYFLNKTKADAPDFGGRKVYALGIDVERRGLADRLVDGVELIDYDGVVELLFGSESVVNL